MARLPLPGSDDGTWGNILNDFLSVQHNSDGTHNLPLNALNDVSTSGVSSGQVLQYNGSYWQPGTITTGSSDPTLGGDLSGTASNAQIATGVVGATEIADGSITNTEISATAAIEQSKIANLTTDLSGKVPATRLISTGSGLTGGGDLSADRTISAVNTSTTALGIIQLAGDLAGTATAPTVPGLSNKINTAEKGQPNGVATLDSDGKIIPGQLGTSSITKILPYSYTGAVGTSTGQFRLYNDTGANWTILGVRASVGIAPDGDSMIVDINKNGTTIFTTQSNRPTIAAGDNTSGNVTNMDVSSVAVGEYLTVDVDQVGSISAGTDLTVQVEVA